MTIEELKERKAHLEKVISNYINQFEKDTGLQIDSIDFMPSKKVVIATESFRPMNTTIKPAELSLTVKL